jgi:hypothetical protein
MNECNEVEQAKGMMAEYPNNFVRLRSLRTETDTDSLFCIMNDMLQKITRKFPDKTKENDDTVKIIVSQSEDDSSLWEIQARNDQLKRKWFENHFRFHFSVEPAPRNFKKFKPECIRFAVTGQSIIEVSKEVPISLHKVLAFFILCTYENELQLNIFFETDCRNQKEHKMEISISHEQSSIGIATVIVVILSMP